MSETVIKGLATAMMAGLGLSACTTVNASNNGRPVAMESETIRYETAPCFGTCPVYSVTVTPDGKGIFEGKRFTAVTGTKTFQATPAAYRAFVAKLAPYRPSQNEMLYQPGTPNCANAPTDMPSVDVVWTELSGGLHFRLQLLSGLITGRYLPVDHVHTVSCFEGVSHGLWW
jgi:hypothetical protein